MIAILWKSNWKFKHTFLWESEGRGGLPDTVVFCKDKGSPSMLASGAGAGGQGFGEHK